MHDGIGFMSGGVLGGIRTRPWAALIWGLIACIVAPAALAADCPGHPDALGTSRTLVVDPREHRLLGTMQYRETLPLADHEVVLTFDDGPLPRNSNQVLEILASQCVKATFFEIGRMAQAYPEGVRKLRDAGHTIGTHTQNHPLSMNRMSIERAKQEIDDGIASVKAALGDDADTALAPFFRIPGLLRADNVEDYLATQGIQIWSADFPADDWRHIPSSRVYDIAMSRLEAKGKGILLLHDIQARTVAALPRILKELKARGYHIVHVVPATAERPATPTEPEQWRLHPESENVAIAHWSKIPNFVFADTGTLPAPSLSDFAWLDAQPVALAEPFDRTGQATHGVPLPREALWPRLSELPPENAAVTLPAPAQSIFEMPEGLHVALHRVTPPLHRAEQAGPGAAGKPVSADTGDSRRVTRGKRRFAHGLERSRRHGRSKVADHATPPAAATHRGPLKHLVQVKKRNV
jgi:peptidoglycan/xylan/chitin deacetylase (PgdA/CDA1 family)